MRPATESAGTESLTMTLVSHAEDSTAINTIQTPSPSAFRVQLCAPSHQPRTCTGPTSSLCPDGHATSSDVVRAGLLRKRPSLMLLSRCAAWPRPSGGGASPVTGWASTMRALTPSRTIHSAYTSPAGPAPMTSTSTSDAG